MARAPLQVLVIPYRKAASGGHEFAVFHCAGGSMWQFVSGGAEDQETPIEAAKRELFEEAGITSAPHWLALDSRGSVPRTAFPQATHWPKDVLVVPEHPFAVDVTSMEIQLSPEHSEFKWLGYDEAMRVLTWETNRTALWELGQRLAG